MPVKPRIGRQPLLVALVLLGAGLRWLRLGSESLWLDEALSLKIAALPWRQVIAAVASDVHPPFYFLLLHGWMWLFGTSEVAVRSLSVIAGILALPALFVCVRTLFGPTGTAPLATLFLAISYFHLNFSQETRGYALVVLLSLLSMTCYWRLTDRPRNRIAAWYVLTTTLLIYTHYYGLFVPLVQNLHKALAGRGQGVRWKLWLVAQLLIGLAYLPWGVTLLQQTSTVAVLTHQASQSLETVLALFRRFSGNLPELVWFMVPLAAWGMWTGVRRATAGDQLRSATNDRQATLLLALWLCVPIVVPLALERTFPTFTDKNAIVCLPAFVILAARGMGALRWPSLQASVLVAVVGLSLFGLGGYYTTVRKEQWREVAAYVDAHWQPGDMIFFDIGPTQTAFDYYARHGDEELPRATFPNYVGNINAALRPLLEDRPRVWLIVTTYGIDRARWRKDTLARYYCLAARQIRYGGLGIWLFAQPSLTAQRPALPVTCRTWG